MKHIKHGCKLRIQTDPLLKRKCIYDAHSVILLSLSPPPSPLTHARAHTHTHTHTQSATFPSVHVTWVVVII
jgi:hypothetical protein